MNPAASGASQRPVFGSQPSRDDAQDRERRTALRTMRKHRGGRRWGRGGLDFHHGMRHLQNRVRACSSEGETGSRQENASNQESRAPFRFNRNGKGSIFCLSMISAQTRSAFVARENRYPLFRIML